MKQGQGEGRATGRLDIVVFIVIMAVHCALCIVQLSMLLSSY